MAFIYFLSFYWHNILEMAGERITHSINNEINRVYQVQNNLRYWFYRDFIGKIAAILNSIWRLIPA